MSQLVMVSPTSAALFVFDTIAGRVERFDISLTYDTPDPSKCNGEIIRQTDLTNVDAYALLQQFQAQMAKGIERMFTVLVPPSLRPELKSEEDPTAILQVVDGQTKRPASVPVAFPFFPEPLQTAYQIAAHVTADAGIAPTDENVIATAAYGAAVTFQGPFLKPDWYWGASTEESRRARAPTPLFVRNETFVLDDSDTDRNFYNDLGSAGDLSFSGIVDSIVHRSFAFGLAKSEQAICEHLATDPTLRYAYVPMMVTQKADTVFLVVEVAQTPSQFLTGGCGCP
jgi:hypothetical protein